MSLVSINTYPVKPVLKLLLTDKTTKRNILIATNAYEDFGAEYAETSELTPGKLVTMKILPRVEKELEQQRNRTRSKAEVFTPSWVCNEQNNLVDEQWFEGKLVFNKSMDKGWELIEEKIPFASKGRKTWKQYVDAKRLEITCGEAPYLVSRYDTVTGEEFPIKSRIGLLDRKLRVVGENTEKKEDWIKWARRAVESVYGYEFQGDNLFLARQNILFTYIEYYRDRYEEDPGSMESRRTDGQLARRC